MMHEILFALWFFLPAGIANTTPPFANKIPFLNKWDTPLDFGLSWQGKRIFGDHKTWRGLITGTLLAIIVLWIQVWLYNQSSFIQSFSQIDYGQLPILLLGILLGGGALLGDAIESFFKRRLNIKSGEPWFVFDQIDYIIGGILASAIIVRLSFIQYVLILILYFGLHLVVAYGAYKLKLKDKPI